ncbi:MAG: stage II sporulation protein P [Oscillospiraceae bacterium]|nr:stage II sporulation protein P [Oscillospiraceae bacterium]
MARKCRVLSAVLLMAAGGFMTHYLPVLTQAAGAVIHEEATAVGVTPELFLSSGFGEDFTEETESTEVFFPSEGEIITPSPDAGPKPYPTKWDLTGGTVEKMSYGRYSGTQYFDLRTCGQVRNETSHANEELYDESLHKPDFTIARTTVPQVLIMHTHTTECFEPYERDAYDANFNYRTTDPALNICRVGDAIAEQLENAGIGVIHDTTIHDYPSYTGSYERSRRTVQAILDAHPSIKVVLDIHRDAIGGNGVIKQPTVRIDGKKAAQVMIISGCDDGTMGMPDYMKNFRFACMLQQQMESDYEGLTRPILFDYRHYNQDMTTGSLLIEVGTHGNTLEQVVYSGELIGKSLSRTLIRLED